MFPFYLGPAGIDTENFAIFHQIFRHKMCLSGHGSTTNKMTFQGISNLSVKAEQITVYRGLSSPGLLDDVVLLWREGTGGLEARTRSSRGDEVAETEKTGETERDP